MYVPKRKHILIFSRERRPSSVLHKSINPKGKKYALPYIKFFQSSVTDQKQHGDRGIQMKNGQKQNQMIIKTLKNMCKSYLGLQYNFSNNVYKKLLQLNMKKIKNSVEKQAKVNSSQEMKYKKLLHMKKVPSHVYQEKEH